MSEIRYEHVLDDKGACSCGQFVMAPSDPRFTDLATEHFLATTTAAVRDQTGWRGLVNRLRGRTP